MQTCTTLSQAQAVPGVVLCHRVSDTQWIAYEEGDALPQPTLAEQQAALQASIVDQVQSNLDAFAQSRGYDNVLSACTYAASTVTQFQTEGQRCVNLRDQTWNALYTVLASIQAGNWPTTGAGKTPTGYDDIASSLPALTWS